MSRFLETLRIQRWDDHRYYHHSLINQSLHFLSAVTFMAAYLVMFHDPAIAALMGWLIAMVSRQAGHFFFEPRDYDEVNQATDEYKEAIKVGYNIKRKIVLMTIWGLSPVLLTFDPSLPRFAMNWQTGMQYARHLGYLWFVVGIAGLAFRTIQLIITRDLITGLAWAVKIITDPFNDARLYCRSPLRLLRGGLIDTTLSDEEPAEAHH